MEKVERLLSRNVEEIIDAGHLRAALLSGKKLRIKFGIDPTGDKIHIGRAVALWKLREFQDLGHTIVLIIGDFTAQIGDPSDKLEKRPFLTKAQVAKNLKNYLPQIGKIIDLKKTEIRYNSEWLKKLNFQEISELAETFTVQQMVSRRNFKTRWDAEQDISLREFLYPLMQGYDSVAVKADVELGGSDQLFNLFAGRKIQERYGQKPQDIMTTKMLIGLDGRKMTTTWGNVINVIDVPEEQFGKVMSVRDDLISAYFEMATDADAKPIAKGVNPKEEKMRLAFEVVKRYHGEKAAVKAGEHFDKLFSKHEIPEDVPTLKVKRGTISALDLVVATGAVKSKGEARRLIEQGGFDVEGKNERNPQVGITLKGGEVLKLGKHRFYKVKIG